MGFFERYIFIMFIIFVGMALGWFFCWYYKIKPLKNQNKELKSVETFSLTIPGWGGKEVVCRKSEWPIDAKEYLSNILCNEGFAGNLDADVFEHHLNQFATIMTNRQKRDFMKMLKQMRSTDEILQKINF